MTPITLPTVPQARKASPLDARVFLGGQPKVGKTTLASRWNPDHTLFLDCEGGTRMLDGEHFVVPVARYQDFVEAVDALTGTDHPYKTVIIDTIDSLVKLCDRHVADGRRTIAAGVVEFGKGLAELEALVSRDVGRLLVTDAGVWFLGHTEIVGDDKASRMVPTVDKRVRPYIVGACDFLLLAEAIGPRRIIHTQPSDRYEAGSRVPMPEPLDMDARKLYQAMQEGLKSEPAAKTSGRRRNGAQPKAQSAQEPKAEGVTA